MSLTIADKKYIQEAVVNTILEAVETLINPRFDRLEKDIVEIRGDLKQLKAEMRDVKERLVTIEGRMQALEADVKELYHLYEKRMPEFFNTKEFTNLSVEEKLIVLEKEIEIIAESEGISLTYLRAK